VNRIEHILDGKRGARGLVAAVLLAAGLLWSSCTDTTIDPNTAHKVPPDTTGTGGCDTCGRPPVDTIPKEPNRTRLALLTYTALVEDGGKDRLVERSLLLPFKAYLHIDTLIPRALDLEFWISLSERVGKDIRTEGGEDLDLRQIHVNIPGVTLSPQGTSVPIRLLEHPTIGTGAEIAWLPHNRESFLHQPTGYDGPRLMGSGTFEVTRVDPRRRTINATVSAMFIVFPKGNEPDTLRFKINLEIGY
jgi:hypothetical protein